MRAVVFPCAMHRRRPAFHRDMTDAEIVKALKACCRPGLHNVGTCRMGSNDDAVVDPASARPRRRGLRVADASIMPRQISANTNAAAIMIGERAAVGLGPPPDRNSAHASRFDQRS